MLVSCRSCKRHVRVSELRCPFCAVLVLALALLPTSADADEPSPPPEERMVQPIYGLPPPPSERRPNAVQLELGLAVIGLAYERVLTPRLALQVEAHTFGTWWAEPHFRGWGGQVRPTIFVTGDAPRGVYVAPFFRGAAVSAKANDVTGHGFGWSAGVFVGYSFLFADTWNLRIGGGAQYMHYGVDAGTTRVEWKRFYPALDLVLGYQF